MARYDRKTKTKVARYAVAPGGGKQPKIKEAPPSDANAKFIWRVNDSYIDYDYHELGWCNCDSLTLLKVVIKELQSHEGLTWQEVREKSEHNHSWKFHELPKKLQDRLAKRKLEYLPELFQISLANKPRIWGFKSIATLFLIWYDPRHEGCKTKAK